MPRSLRWLPLFLSLTSLQLLAPALASTLVPTQTPALAQTNSPIDPVSAPANNPNSTNPNISFRRPLRITSIRVSNDFELRRAEYRFTLDFPADAVEPLEKLVFEQVEGAGYPRYQTDDSYAFDGTDGMPLPLRVVESDRDSKTITVAFDPPIEPGRQITVALNARNPRSGTYVYQFTAFPTGATTGQYAGVDRFSIFDPFIRRRFGR